MVGPARLDPAALPFGGQRIGNHRNCHALVITPARQHAHQSAHHLRIVAISQHLTPQLTLDELFGPKTFGAGVDPVQRGGDHLGVNALDAELGGQGALAFS